ncbi:hypothetical protein L9F63_004220, partial [Diploptera punctata]
KWKMKTNKLLPSWLSFIFYVLKASLKRYILPARSLYVLLRPVVRLLYFTNFDLTNPFQ